MKNLILSSICALGMVLNANAQFLKNLKDKVERRVEQKVTDNIANKAASEADKSLNKMWETQLSKGPMAMGANRVDASEVPERYEFDWAYQMQMTTEQGTINMNYFLSENDSYFGMHVKEGGDMYMVLDMDKNLSVMYLNSEGNKFLMASKFDLEDTETEEDHLEDYRITELGEKTILGYRCKGYQAENDEYVMTMYVTNEAPVSFMNMQQNKQAKLPKGFNADWLKEGNALMMEMDFKNKKRPKESGSMRCVGLEKQQLTINKNDYNSL